MADIFYPGQTDYLQKLNELARAQDVVDIPANSAAAATSAAAAAQSASSAKTDAGSASASATAAAASFAAFDIRYLGAKAAAPEKDNQGGSLVDGASYWDTALNDGCLRVRQGGQWVTVPANLASQVSSTPSAGVSATNVQAALNELDAKKVASASLAKVATSGSKADVGLGNVDNTSDATKPVSSPQMDAIKAREPTIAAAASGAQLSSYWRGDKNWRDFATDVRAAALAGLSTASGAVVTAADTILAAIGKLQAQATTAADALVLKAPLLAPVFTGDVRIGRNLVVQGIGGDNLKIALQDSVGGAQVSRGFLSADANNCFRAINATNTAYALSVDNSGNLYTGGTAQHFSNKFNPRAGSWTTNGALRAVGAYGGGVCLIDDQSGMDGAALWVQGSTMYFGAGSAAGLTTCVLMNQSSMFPATNAGYELGTAWNRWAAVYASTGTIQTSDAKHKTKVLAASNAELAAAQDMAREVGFFKFLDAVAAKGSAARQHAGLTVQRAIEIMDAHGLDALSYAFICYDEWNAETYEHPAEYEQIKHPPEVIEHPATSERDAWIETRMGRITQGVEIKPAWIEVTRAAGSIYSFRPDELNLFIARGLAARLDAIEHRLNSLSVSA